MDDLTMAVYRVGALIAAASNRHERTSIQELAQDAQDLLDELVPEEELHPEAPELAPVQQHPDADTFLEEVRQRAKLTVSAKDKEKMARAAAMADEEKMEHDNSETPIDIRR